MTLAESTRRVRHISNVQIRNFTPFPRQDELALPHTGPIQNAVNGYHVDDMDIAANRRRGRRISSTSSMLMDQPSEKPSAKRKKSDASSIGRGGSPTVRPSHRTRTTSMMSSHSTLYPHSITMKMPDNSQKYLEQSIHSRLIETFLAITVIEQDVTLESRPVNGKAINAGSKRHARDKSGSSDHSFTKSGITSTKVSTEHAISHAQIPDYISSVHKPSTNPSFSIDASTTTDFAEGTNLSRSRIVVEVYGNIRFNVPKGKGKERKIQGNEQSDGWTVLKEWNLNLKELVQLPENFQKHPSCIPPNTLIISLSGKKYVLPPHQHQEDSVSTRASGYSSDSELESRLVSLSNNLPNGISRKWQGGHKTALNQMANWQDLVKLATLHGVKHDTEESLSAVVAGMNAFIDRDEIGRLKREISERESTVEFIRSGRRRVIEETGHLRTTLRERRDILQERRDTLAAARETLRASVNDASSVEETLSEERYQLTSIRHKTFPIRTRVISTLSQIYPIELISPPDLLFTILAASLPLPINPTDPAPPLSVSARPDINEETIATALGYAAQVVHSLAQYLGKALVYPITFVGSRSLIKDGISSMVGPRIFPLFSKGVDTYRFEYGVFLLNKNIEILMADRDLHTLDMRHTLPNLKNLLLTLTDVEPAWSTDTPSTLAASPSSSDDKTDLSDKKASSETMSSLASSYFPSSKTILGLSGFFRTRPPSIAVEPSINAVEEGTESHDVGSDEDDRRTIRESGREGQEKSSEDENGGQQVNSVPTVTVV